MVNLIRNFDKIPFGLIVIIFNYLSAKTIRCSLLGGALIVAPAFFAGGEYILEVSYEKGFIVNPDSISTNIFLC